MVGYGLRAQGDPAGTAVWTQPPPCGLHRPFDSTARSGSASLCAPDASTFKATYVYKPYFYLGLSDARFATDVSSLLRRKFDTVPMVRPGPRPQAMDARVRLGAVSHADAVAYLPPTVVPMCLT